MPWGCRGVEFRGGLEGVRVWLEPVVVRQPAIGVVVERVEPVVLGERVVVVACPWVVQGGGLRRVPIFLHGHVPRRTGGDGRIRVLDAR